MLCRNKRCDVNGGRERSEMKTVQEKRSWQEEWSLGWLFGHLPFSVSWRLLHRRACHETPPPPRVPDTAKRHRQRHSRIRFDTVRLLRLTVSCSSRKRSHTPNYSCWSYRTSGRRRSMCGNSGALPYHDTHLSQKTSVCLASKPPGSGEVRPGGGSYCAERKSCPFPR